MSLKSKLSKSSISNGKRFIILDDVETFNKNSLNALLKIIEEPSTNDYFILINNETKKSLKLLNQDVLKLRFCYQENKRTKLLIT